MKGPEIVIPLITDIKSRVEEVRGKKTLQIKLLTKNSKMLIMIIDAVNSQILFLKDWILLLSMLLI